MNETVGHLIARLAQTNIELWHEEDKARVNDDQQVAAAKRAVDKLNQQRNDLDMAHFRLLLIEERKRLEEELEQVRNHSTDMDNALPEEGEGGVMTVDPVGHLLGPGRMCE